MAAPQFMRLGAFAIEGSDDFLSGKAIDVSFL
jgi:hypothetical protein